MQATLPHIDQALCTGCGDCIAVCPTAALSRVGGKATLVNAGACTRCAACEDVCPVYAIELPFFIIKRPQERANPDA